MNICLFVCSSLDVYIFVFVFSLVLLLEKTQQPEEVNVNVEKGPELTHLQEKNQKTFTNEISETSEINETSENMDENILNRNPNAAGDHNASRSALALDILAPIEEKTKPQTASAIEVDSVGDKKIVPKSKKQKSKALYTVRALVDNPNPDSKSKLAFSIGDEIAVYDNTTRSKYHLGKLIKSELHPLDGKKLYFKPQNVVKIEGSTRRRRASMMPSSSSRAASGTAHGESIRSKTRRSSVI